MRPAVWELLGILVFLGAYLALPKKIRRVDNPKSLTVNIGLALGVIAALVWVAVAVNGYSSYQMGLGWNVSVWSAICLGEVTFIGFVGLLVITRINRRVPSLSRNMLKLGALYPLWAYVQQFLVLGIVANFLVDCLGVTTSVIVVGALFGALHFGKWLLLALTAVIGAAWAASFFAFRDLISIAISQGVLATLFYYWVEGRDQWKEVFGGQAASR